jgi:hypothetical protein
MCSARTLILECAPGLGELSNDGLATPRKHRCVWHRGTNAAGGHSTVIMASVTETLARRAKE